MDDVKHYTENLIQGIIEQNYYRVKYSVLMGADVNARIGQTSETILTLCLKHPDIKIFDYLVSVGADVTKKVGHTGLKEYEKQSFLMHAFQYSNITLDFIEIILKNGGSMDVNYAPQGMNTPAEKAYIAEDKELLALFSKYADIRIKPSIVESKIKIKSKR